MVIKRVDPREYKYPTFQNFERKVSGIANESNLCFYVDRLPDSLAVNFTFSIAMCK